MQNVETGIDAIDVHPCVGTHCNMDSEQDSICEREVNEYKVINARPRIITPYKRKARLPSNTRVSVVSAHHFEIEYETQRWGTTDQPEEGDKIIVPSMTRQKKEEEELIQGIKDISITRETLMLEQEESLGDTIKEMEELLVESTAFITEITESAIDKKEDELLEEIIISSLGHIILQEEETIQSSMTIDDAPIAPGPGQKEATPPIEGEADKKEVFGKEENSNILNASTDPGQGPIQDETYRPTAETWSIEIGRAHV